MQKYSNRRNLSVLLLGLVSIGIVAILGFAPPQQGPQPQKMPSISGPKVVIRADDTYFPYYVPPPKQAELGIQSANIVVIYNPPSCSGNITAWPAAAQNAFSFAANIWATLLNSNQTIVVNACWRSDLGPTVLGSAGSVSFFRNVAGEPISNTWYPVALANTLENSDLNNIAAEIEANFSSTFPWYYGTDGNTPPSQYDFVSVVLHELGHGLGFSGSMSVSSTSGQGSWGFGSGFPFIYDRFTEDGSGNSLLNVGMYPNPSFALAGALQSDNIFFNGPNANAANGGSQVSLYAPGMWSQGSSYSHLGEVFNSTPHDLMTFSIGFGTAIHNPGPVTLGMFEDMGWTVNTGADLSLSKQLIGTDHQPGDPVTFTLTIENVGLDSATTVTVEDIIPTDILTPTWIASPSAGVTEQLGPAFTWDLPDLAPNDILTITISGTIDPALPSEFAIVNTATVDASEIETNLSNNSSTAIVGGRRLLLPIILN